MKKILFVCTGNTCRSPMAAALFNRMAAQREIRDVIAESAGLAALEGDCASTNAILAAREAGAELSGHRARLVSSALLEQADAIYVMSPSHQSALSRLAPQMREKIRVLGNGIPDPYGGDLRQYQICRDEIMRALQDILKQAGVNHNG